MGGHRSGLFGFVFVARIFCWWYELVSKILTIKKGALAIGMKKLLISILIVFALPSWGLAEDEALKLASHNYSKACTACYAYYTFSAEAYKSRSDFENEDKMKKAAYECIGSALVHARVGRLNEEAQKITAEYVKIMTKDLLNQTNGDFGKISVLDKQFAGTCKKIIEEPAQTLEVLYQQAKENRK